MHVTLSIWLSLSAGLYAKPVTAAVPVEANASARIHNLIVQLGDKSFRKRRKATEELKKLGESAFEALQKAVESRDPEVRARARQLISIIEKGWLIRVFAGHADAVPGIAVSPDGRFLVSAGRSECILRLWEISTGKEVRRFEVKKAQPRIEELRGGWAAPFRGGGSWTWDVSFSADGKQVLSADGAMRLWDAGTGQEGLRFPGHNTKIVSVAVSPKGTLALSGSETDPAPRLWDLKTGKELRRFQGHTQAAWNVAFSRDGSQALSCSRDCTIRIWDVKTGKQLQCLQGHAAPVTAAHFSPDGKRVLSSSWDGTLRLWDARTGKTLRTFTGHTDKVCDVAVSPNGRQALSGGFDNSLILWDVRSGRALRRFKGHGGIVSSVAFVPSGKTALSGSYDKTIRLWQLPK